jgi:hypothetical protein
MNHVLLIEPKFFKTRMKLSRDYIWCWILVSRILVLVNIWKEQSEGLLCNMKL